MSVTQSGLGEALGLKRASTRLEILLGALLAAATLFAANAATASALPEPTSQWGSAETGEPISPRNIGFHSAGQMLVVSFGEWGQYYCEAQGTMALLPKGRGTISSLEFDPETCGGSGLLAGCELQSGGAVGQWPVVAGENSITVGNFKIAATFANQGNCQEAGETYETEALEDWQATVGHYGISTISPLQGEVRMVYPSGSEAFMPYSTPEFELAPKDSEIYELLPPPFASFEPAWTHDGAVLEESSKSNLVGILKFNNPNPGFGEIECEVRGFQTLTPGSSGEVSQLEPTYCGATSGAFTTAWGEECSVEEESGSGHIQSLEAGSSTIDAESIEMAFTLEYWSHREVGTEVCAPEGFQRMEISGENWTLTFGNPLFTSFLEVSGEATINLPEVGWEFETEVSGALQVDQEYGLT